VEIGAAIGWSPFGKGWEWQATTYFVGYGALTFVHGGELWGQSKPQKLP